MSQLLTNTSNILNYEKEKIKFCFKFCSFKKSTEYSDKSKISKFFKRMVEVSSSATLKDKAYFFTLNKSLMLKNGSEKIFKNKIPSNIYDMFKGNNSFRVYGFFEKNVFYILEFDLNHSSRPE